MCISLLKWIGASAAPAAMLVFAAQRPAACGGRPGVEDAQHPDLQGIWTVESDTPLQRSAKYADQEVFTAAQREDLDKERVARLGRDKRVERGTELDVAGAYNAVFMSMKRTGTRTSMIVDPPNGRIPPLTPRAEKIAAADRDFRLALLQATETCKVNSVACSGGKYEPTPSPRRTDLPPRYNTQRITAMTVQKTAHWRTAA